MKALRAFGRKHGRNAGRLAAATAVIAVTVALVWRVGADLASVDRAALRHGLHLDPAPLVAAYAIQTVGWFLMVLVWRRILRHMGEEAPLATHLAAIGTSGLTHVLPGSVWTPVSRVALYRARGVAALPVGAALVVEWLLVGLGGLAWFGAALPWTRSDVPVGAWPLAVVAGVSVAMLHPAIAGPLLRWGSLRTGRGEAAVAPPSSRLLLAWFAGELVVLGLSGLALYALMAAIGPAAALPDALAAWGMSMAVANLLVWLPATSLMKDVGMVVLLTPLYGSSATALAVTVAWRVWMVLVMLSWAVLAAVAERRSASRAATT